MEHYFLYAGYDGNSSETEQKFRGVIMQAIKSYLSNTVNKGATVGYYQ